MEKGNEVTTGGTSVREASAGSEAGPAPGSSGDAGTPSTSPFTRTDGSLMTPDELREAAANEVAFAHGVENNRTRAMDVGEDPERLADLKGMADRARTRAGAMRQEAERLEQIPEPALPSGSITNPDGTQTEMERLPDGTRRETTLDSQGNVVSTRIVERLPGDYVVNEPSDEG